MAHTEEVALNGRCCCCGRGVATEAPSIWRACWRWTIAFIKKVLIGSAVVLLFNAAKITLRAQAGGGDFKLSSLVLTLEHGSVRDLLQLTEATYRDVEMIRFGPLSGAGQANGTASFGRALPGHLVVASLKDLDIGIDKCRTLELRPGDEAAYEGPATLSFDLGDCAASLHAVELHQRGGDASVLTALGVSGEGTLANADFVLEPPSSFSLVFKRPSKHKVFQPLPEAIAIRLELAPDAQPWVVERGLFRRCECKAGDIVELGGPLELKDVSLGAGELKARIKLSEGSAISCGPGGSHCGFNQELISPLDMLGVALKPRGPGA
jgi:hypothetical protein